MIAGGIVAGFGIQNPKRVSRAEDGARGERAAGSATPA